MPLENNTDTISVIREITCDGQVTDEEVIALATYLNDHPEACDTWPGIAVFDILKDILADGEIDEVERDALQVILQGIEIICAGSVEYAIEEAETEPTPAPLEDIQFQAEPLRLPELDPQRVHRLLSDGKAGQQLVDYQCDCDTWNTLRADFSRLSPGRICRCLAPTIISVLKEDRDLASKWPRILPGIIRKAAGVGRGLDPVEEWTLLTIGKAKFIVSRGKTEWFNVYEGTDGKVEKFSFHGGKRRWGHGARPQAAASVAAAINRNLKP